MTTATWRAPGQGLWQRDDVHAPHAMTRYFATVFNPVFDAGMRAALRSYGLPLDHFDIQVVGQRQYTRPRPIGAPEKPGAPPPRFVITLLFLLHPELRYRKKRAAEVFAKKLWRQDHAWWHNELGPKLRRTNQALQQVDPATLDEAELRAHIAATTNAFVEGGKLHFRLAPGCMIPIGDWLRHTCEWTACSPAEAMTVLKGKSQVSIAPDEVSALLGGPGIAPSGEELAHRTATRQRLNLEEMPLQLGEMETPPPADLLLPACARAMQATMFFMAHSNFATTSQSAGTKAATLMEKLDRSSSLENGKPVPLHGQGVSHGRYEGRARVVQGPADFEKIEAGDVLVTRTTSPAYNVLLPLLGAVVTDRGGVLCHAAIVAREFGIPAVVGTGDATSRIADGTRIVVDGERGTVEILE